MAAMQQDNIEVSNMKDNNPSVFPMGNKLPDEVSKFFIGQAYLKELTDRGVRISNITFEPGCRNNWHIHHHGGQILLVTGGEGWFQILGEPARKLLPGDVINIPAEAKHWHGASQYVWFSHLSVVIPAENASTEWLEPVCNDEFEKL